MVFSVDGADRPSTRSVARFLTGRGLHGVVLAPVVFWDSLVGVLEFGSATPAGLATATHVAHVAADLLAVALGSGDVIARLQRRNRDLGLVVEAGLEDTARLSTDEVLHAVVERLSDLTHTPVADIYAVEGDTLRGLVSYDSGRFDVEWDGVVLPLRRYPCSRRAVETGEIVIAATLDDPLLVGEGRYSLEKWGYQAQLSMPLVSRGHVLGVVELSDYQPRDFAEDLDLIRGLGQVAAHALENASLFEQVDRRNRILNELVELGSLASRTRDLDELVRSVAERILGAVDAANCDIYRVVDGVLRCVASFDRSGHDESVLGSAFDLERYPTTVEAMYNHQILAISSPEDPQLSEAERSTYHDYGFSSEVCLPLVVNDELFGLLDIYDTRERDFSEYLSFLRSSAQTIAGAFESALLVEQLEQRTTVLRDIVELGAVASQAHDLETVLTALAQRLRDTIGAADCDIFTLQDDKLRCLVSADRDGLDAGVVGHVLDIDRFPATALAVRTGAAHGDLEPRRPAPHRRGAGGHGRVRVRERALHPARRRRPGDRSHRRVRHAAPRLRRVPRLPAQRGADGRRRHRERPAARQARAPQRGARRARRAGQDGLERRRPSGAGALGRPPGRRAHGGGRLPDLHPAGRHAALRADLRRRRVPRRLRRPAARPRPLPQHAGVHRREVRADHREPGRPAPERLRARAVRGLRHAERDLRAHGARGPRRRVCWTCTTIAGGTTRSTATSCSASGR